MLLRISVPGFRNKVYRSLGGLFVPLFDAFVSKHNNILAVLKRPDGKILIPGANIVTDAGDEYYAQKSAGETPSPSNTFDVHVLASAGTPGKSATYDSFTPIASTEKAHSATYPKTLDTDTDNTGAGVDIVTYLASYAKTDFSHSAITHGMITNASPTLSPDEPLLTGYAFASSFAKTTDDTLKVFVNHEFLGV